MRAQFFFRFLLLFHQMLVSDLRSAKLPTRHNVFVSFFRFFSVRSGAWYLFTELQEEGVGGQFETIKSRSTSLRF